LVVSLAFAAGCSDEEETPPQVDAARPADSAADTTTTDGAGTDGAADGAGDGASVDSGADDAPAADGATTDGGAGDGSTDGGTLTTQQLRGRYLVDHVIGCPDCHAPMLPTGMPDFSKYMAGGFCFIPAPGGQGCLLASRNLTNDETGLKNRTDADIKAMILDGRRPAATGDEALFPIMPYYVFHNMKPEDADAIVAYLRVIPGVNNPVPRRNPMFDIPAPAPALPVAKIPAVPADYAQKESAERGKYLTSQVGLCIECHTQHLMPGPGVMTVLNEDKLFQGGEDFSGFFPPQLMFRIVSKNITSDPTTGIGNLTAADIVKVLKQGTKKDGKPVCPPMPAGPMGPYGGLTDGDAMDIANYIKSLAPKVNDTGMNVCMPPGPPPADGGATDAAAGG
jgi:hypothetical protein